MEKTFRIRKKFENKSKLNSPVVSLLGVNTPYNKAENMKCMATEQTNSMKAKKINQ